MIKQLDIIMEREMSRKEFLTIMGLGLGSIMGLSTIIKLLTGKSLDTRLSAPMLSGYSTGAYGGGKD